MEYLKLNNGVEMPVEGLGTFLMTPAEAEAASLAALEAGYEHIDTANAYMNEKAVGRAIAKSGVDREKLFVSTKLWPSVYEAGDAAVDGTLARLGLEYVDMLILHQPVGDYLAAWKTMEKAYRDGKVRARPLQLPAGQDRRGHWGRRDQAPAGDRRMPPVPARRAQGRRYGGRASAARRGAVLSVSAPCGSAR